MIRKAEILDAERIREIYSHYVENTAITFAYDSPSTAEFEEKISSAEGRHIYLVLENEGKPAGYAYSSIYRERKAYEHTVEVSVYVDQNDLGKGYGTLLMNELLRQLKEKGVVIAIAVISSGNESSSRAFTKLGFTFSGHLPMVGYKFAKWYGIDHFYKIL